MTAPSSNGTTTTKLKGDYSKLHDATTTHLDDKLGKCLHGHFRSQASKTPDRIALMEQNRKSVTYVELDKASDQLAVMLLKKGLVKDDSVGILMERRMEYALSYVAIHKAGGAYLPLDPAYPQSLLESVLVDSQPRVVLCTQPFVERLPKDQSYIVLSDDWKDCLQTEISTEDQRMLDAVDEDDLDMLAYIVYSSGTTGKPKGIACPHRGAVFSYLWRHDAIPYKEETTPDGKVQTEIEGCNVFFVWEMMRPLLKGHILCVIPDTVIYDPPSLSKYIEEMKITRMLFTPSLLEAVLDYKTPTSDGGGLTLTNGGGGEHSHDLIASRMKTMTTIVLCGEVVTVTLWERCKTRLPWTTIWNLYSVSECHDVAAINLSSGKEDYKGRKYCPVGRLLPGVEAHVMEVIEPDDAADASAAEPTLLPKALGEVGELYVAGPTLARGYVGLDELTSKRFPTVNGIRLYKTGDRARVLPNRQLEILGRCDSMVKVRGYSVELRAIESAIMTLTDLVSSCCVIVQGDEGEDKFVIAYVVLQKDNPQATCRNVRLALKAKLVHYMVPAYLVALDELPTHEVSGKLNKKALPPVDVNSPDGGMTSDCTVPRTSLESKLHAIWCDIMNMKQIDVIFDSFFDIGGHSLLAARLVQRISVELPEWTSEQNKEVTVVDLFSHATIAQLATFLSGETIPAAAPNGTSGDDTTALMVEELQKLDLMMEVTQYDTSEAVSDQAMRAFWRSTHFKQVKARSVLLTGATGFLGSFLLYELLKGSGSYHVDIVYCLVRATSDAEAAHRLQEKLQQQDMWEDEFALKLQVFAGDASLHQLGLDDDDYAMLSTGVDMIVHCAAMVNLVYPYEGLRSANVVGTSNIIKYALTGRVKKLAYISTDAVFPDGLPKGTICQEEDDLQSYAETLAKTGNGYSQSKWVAEILVRHAQDRGLPALIFRPGNMGGSTKGIWNPSDLNFLVLKGCIALGMVPNIPGWIMEMTPVDFASKAIISICCGKTNNSGDEPNANLGKTFHVTNFANCLQANEYFKALQSVGIPLETLSLKEWRDKVLATDSIELQKLRNFLLGGAMSSVEAMTELAILDNTLFATKCQQMGYEVPQVTASTMKDYFYTWKALGMITLPKRTPVGLPGHPLAGKVVLITGASSGIGAAIATALSSAGARVGIGGRRLDRLKSLASQLMERPGAAMVHPCQVDVTNRQDMERFVKECEQALQGPTDIFVNNAGVMYYGRLEAMREHEWHNELEVNCKGLLHATACILPGMLSRGSGHIVVTSSDAGRKVFAGLANYSATKFFVEAFCQGMRLENADRGLKVTTIQPGDCRTELSKLTTDADARSEFAQSSQAREYWLDPEDVAQAVLFAVASPYHVGVNEILIEPRGAPI